MVRGMVGASTFGHVATSTLETGKMDSCMVTVILYGLLVSVNDKI